MLCNNCNVGSKEDEKTNNAKSCSKMQKQKEGNILAVLAK